MKLQSLQITEVKFPREVSRASSWFSKIKFSFVGTLHLEKKVKRDVELQIGQILVIIFQQINKTALIFSMINRINYFWTMIIKTKIYMR